MGNFVGPTILSDVTEGMECYRVINLILFNILHNNKQ